MKYCPNCGAAVEEGQRFCGECGAKLNFDPLPTEPVYTEDERLKSDPVLNAGREPAPQAKQKRDKVPELTLEPDLWGAGTAAAAEQEKKPRKTPELTLEPDLWGVGTAAAAEQSPEAAQKPDRAAEALQAVERDADSGPAERVEDFDYERPDAEYHGPAQSAQGDYRRPRAENENPLPDDYTMSQTPIPGQRLPDETLMLIWSIGLTCTFSICGIVGLVKTIKARKTLNYAMKQKLLKSAKIWLIVGTALRVLPFLADLF